MPYGIYLKIAVMTVSMCARRSIRAVFQVHEMATHVFVRPRFITSQIGNVVPFIVRCPDKVHGVDLRAATKRCAAGIQDT